MSKVSLETIRSLTFYKDERTRSRRAKSIPQLTCIGKPCDLFQPEAVRCTNVGGYGTDVDWKCEADLPEALRFGRVEVSCEGWDGPGDPYVMKGSCGLEYRLVLIPKNLRGGAPDNPRYPSYPARYLQAAAQDPISTVFILLCLVVLGIILIAWSGCLGSRGDTNSSQTRPRPPSRGPGSGGWFSGGGRGDHSDAPPPYSKYTSTPSTSAGATGSDAWRPGFWTGAALGGFGTYLMNRREAPPTRQTPGTGAYDWETVRPAPSPAPAYTPWWSGATTSGRRAAHSSNINDDRGEGSSDLGRMRSSVGLGGSNVR